MTIDDIYKNFCDDFMKTSSLTRDSGDADWTKGIYSYFYNIGKENGFAVYCRPNVIKAGENEYLVDLCWSRGSEYKDYKGLELTLESEWLKGKNDILDDFCKLVDVKSIFKIMIICVKDEKINLLLEDMKTIIRNSAIEQKQEDNHLIIFLRPLPIFSNPEQYVIEGYKINNKGLSNKLQTVDFVFGNLEMG